MHVAYTHWGCTTGNVRSRFQTFRQHNNKNVKCEDPTKVTLTESLSALQKRQVIRDIRNSVKSKLAPQMDPEKVKAMRTAKRKRRSAQKALERAAKVKEQAKKLGKDYWAYVRENGIAVTGKGKVVMIDADEDDNEEEDHHDDDDDDDDDDDEEEDKLIEVDENGASSSRLQRGHSSDSEMSQEV